MSAISEYFTEAYRQAQQLRPKPVVTLSRASDAWPVEVRVRSSGGRLYSLTMPNTTYATTVEQIMNEITRVHKLPVQRIGYLIVERHRGTPLPVTIYNPYLNWTETLASICYDRNLVATSSGNTINIAFKVLG